MVFFLSSRYKIVIFSGDSDLCVPYTYSSWWTEGLGFQVSNDWHAWMSSSLHGGYTVGGYAIESVIIFLFVHKLCTQTRLEETRELSFYNSWYV